MEAARPPGECPRLGAGTFSAWEFPGRGENLRPLPAASAPLVPTQRLSKQSRGRLRSFPASTPAPPPGVTGGEPYKGAGSGAAASRCGVRPLSLEERLRPAAAYHVTSRGNPRLVSLGLSRTWAIIAEYSWKQLACLSVVV